MLTKNIKLRSSLYFTNNLLQIETQNSWHELIDIKQKRKSEAHKNILVYIFASAQTCDR